MRPDLDGEILVYELMLKRSRDEVVFSTIASYSYSQSRSPYISRLSACMRMRSIRERTLKLSIAKTS